MGCFVLAGNLTLWRETTPGGRPCLTQRARRSLSNQTASRERPNCLNFICMHCGLFTRDSRSESLSCLLEMKLSQRMDTESVFHLYCLQKNGSVMSSFSTNHLRRDKHGTLSIPGNGKQVDFLSLFILLSARFHSPSSWLHHYVVTNIHRCSNIL